MKAGRSCPMDYAISPTIFQEEPVQADSFYIIGGLYGNPFALKKLKEDVQKEKEATGIEPTLIFNGDYHWFDCDPQSFAWIEETISQDIKMLGNVEAEFLRQGQNEAGCGCAYPSTTSDQTVEWSNAIHAQLKTMVQGHDFPHSYFKHERPPALCIEAKGHRIAVLHGDEKWLAGWENDASRLMEEDRQQELKNFMDSHQLDAISCTHTCRPVVLEWPEQILINNGSSGMASCDAGLFGLYCRISDQPSPRALYRKSLSSVYMELLPLEFDQQAFLNWFDELWPAGSPAALSYRDRISQGLKEPLTVIQAP